MKDFLETIVKNLVQDPNQVKVTEEENAGRVVLTISVADDDMGRIIGKEGKVINSIRMIMRVMAIRHDLRVRIDIEDKGEGAPSAAPQALTDDIEPMPVVAPAPTASAQTTPADIVGQPAVSQGTTLLDNSTQATASEAVPATETPVVETPVVDTTKA